MAAWCESSAQCCCTSFDLGENDVNVLNVDQSLGRVTAALAIQGPSAPRGLQIKEASIQSLRRSPPGPGFVTSYNFDTRHRDVHRACNLERYVLRPLSEPKFNSIITRPKIPSGDDDPAEQYSRLLIEFETRSGKKKKVNFRKQFLGMTFNHSMPLKVTRVQPGTDAEENGVEPGWKVKMIGGVDVFREKNFASAVALLNEKRRDLPLVSSDRRCSNAPALENVRERNTEIEPTSFEPPDLLCGVMGA